MTSAREPQLRADEAKSVLGARAAAERGGRLPEWSDAVEESLREHRDLWVARAGAVGAEGLTRDQAWVLLGWVEDAAPRVTGDQRGRLLQVLCFALALHETGTIDRRDVSVVASLVRRSAERGGVDFVRHARRGCAAAGDLGTACWTWLSQVSSELPATHQEVPDGPTSVTYRRREQQVDVDGLERWLRGESS